MYTANCYSHEKSEYFKRDIIENIVNKNKRKKHLDFIAEYHTKLSVSMYKAAGKQRRLIVLPTSVGIYM